MNIFLINYQKGQSFRHLIAILFVVFSSTLNVFSQETKSISLKITNQTIEQAVEILKSQYGISFTLSTDDVNMQKRISVNIKKKNLNEVLNAVFAGENVSITIQDNRVKIGKKEQTVANPVAVNQQTFIVYGKIVDEMNEPLIGVSIVEKGTTNGSVTSTDGEFSLELQSGNKQKAVIISYLGMKPLEINVTKANLGIIVLKEDSKYLDEVVIVGYGVQKRTEISGSIVSINADQIAKQSTISIAEMLRGQASGVHITQGSARPGGTANIIIRGIRSLNGGNQPLFVLDGVPVSDIDNVNASDIASIEVLKDASSTAIYGARAANGVILVNTKRAKENTFTVSVTAQGSIQQLKRNFDLYSADEWAQLRREAVRTQNGGVYPTDQQAFSAPVLAAMANNSVVDWTDLMLRDALLQKYDVSVQSGSDRTKYMLSVGYLTEEGMSKYASFRRFSLRQNIEHKLLNNLTVGANIAYSVSRQHIEDQDWDGFNRYITSKPYSTPFDEDGNLNYVLGEDNETNPLWNLREGSNKTDGENLFANLFLEWKIIEGLKYKLNISTNNNSNTNKTFQSNLHRAGRLNNGLGSINKWTNKDMLFENILSFEKNVLKGHKLDATLVQSANEIKYENLMVKGQDFAYGKFGADGINAAGASSVEQHNISKRRILSFMGRVRYSISDKYLATFTMRADGASVFGENNKWGYFPSGSLMWRMSKENFLKEFEALDDLKLRASYGAVGNQAISPYYSLGVAELRKGLSAENGKVNLNTGFLPSGSLYNPSLKWETSVTANLGIDYSFLQNRITGSVEVYDTRTKDLLVDKAISGVLGYTSQRVNLGEVKNQGIEIMMSFTPIRNDNFEWNMGLMFSKNVNELVKIDGKVDENGKPIDNKGNNWFIGKPINVYYNYKFDGIWQTSDQDYINANPTLLASVGDIRVADIDGNKVINDEDKVFYDRDPDFIASFNTSFKYKSFDLLLDIYGVSGVYRHNSYMQSDLTGSGNGMKIDYWTPENPSNTAPRPRVSGMNNPYLSILGYQDASYLRLRNITLGYTLPDSIAKKLYLKSLRLHCSLENFVTITDYKSYSPESTLGDYPEPRTIQFGIKITL